MVYEPGLAEQHAEQERHESPLAQMGIVLGARHVQLALGDLEVADQPRVLALVLAHALERRVGVERGHHRHRSVAVAVRVQHQPRARRDQLQPVVLALGFGVAHGVGVVPHARQVGDVAAELGAPLRAWPRRRSSASPSAASAAPRRAARWAIRGARSRGCRRSHRPRSRPPWRLAPRSRCRVRQGLGLRLARRPALACRGGREFSDSGGRDG